MLLCDDPVATCLGTGIRLTSKPVQAGQPGPGQRVGPVLRCGSARPGLLPLFLRACRASSAVLQLLTQRCFAYPNPLETIMGKYLLAWLLGVPGIVLLLVYLFFH
ncbi:hypothetical protein ASC95_01675 [Pelomonas sp. Root1217]|nr:hypothetical protein ASC95_01675 [Pelomonas sp. Root1217]